MSSNGEKPATSGTGARPPLDTRVSSLSVVTTRCKHDFLLADRALMSRARIHHVEYFRHVCDQLSLGDRSISIRVDLVHHFFGPKTASIASSCESHDVIASAGADKFFRIDNSRLFLVEHHKYLFMKCNPFIPCKRAAAIGHLLH